MQEGLLQSLVARTGVSFASASQLRCTRAGADFCDYEVIWLRDGTMSGLDPAPDGSMPATEQVANTVEWAIGYTVTAAEFTAACSSALDGAQ